LRERELWSFPVEERGELGLEIVSCGVMKI
jgi:hypothetical protein